MNLEDYGLAIYQNEKFYLLTDESLLTAYKNPIFDIYNNGKFAFKIKYFDEKKFSLITYVAQYSPYSFSVKKEIRNNFPLSNLNEKFIKEKIRFK